MRFGLSSPWFLSTPQTLKWSAQLGYGDYAIKTEETGHVMHDYSVISPPRPLK